MTVLCHCNDCQRQAGTAFTVVVGVPRPALAIEGVFKTYESVAASGKAAYRHFCGNCGSPIFTEVDAMPGLAFVKAGTLDDRSWLKPSMQLWCEAAQPWTTQDIAMTRFERMPG